MKYNGYLQSPLKGELFVAKNDFEFNRKLAEQRMIEKDALRKDPTGMNERLREVIYAFYILDGTK